MNKLPPKANNIKGFTLIELLVVISIVGLLASVLLVAVDGARVKARDAKRLADLHQISLALELFAQDNGTYPTNSNYILNVNTNLGVAGSLQFVYPGIVVLNTSFSTNNCGTAGWLLPYIPSICSLSDPQGKPYYYVFNSSSNDYQLGAAFETPGLQTQTLKLGGLAMPGYYVGY